MLQTVIINIAKKAMSDALGDSAVLKEILKRVQDDSGRRDDKDRPAGVRSLEDIPMCSLMSFEEANYYYMRISQSHFKKMMDRKTMFYKPGLAKIFEVPLGRKRGWMVQRRQLENYMKINQGKLAE